MVTVVEASRSFLGRLFFTRRQSTRHCGASAVIVACFSSEIIHGFPFGASYFYSAHQEGERTTEAFRAATAPHLEEIFIGVLHAGCGYLAAFIGQQNMQAPLKAEEKIFTRLLDLSTKSSSEFPAAPAQAEADGVEQRSAT
jgi:hypothetical protein